MSFESKSFLAKLLAEENLSVQVDSKATTAYFNLKSRTITIPNWDDISPAVYDLLLGHEVGHARDTPFEGFHDSSASSPGMKTFLNVCEDARIEKRMKRRYPGLRASFRKGYEDLMARDLFGVKGKNPSKFLLIDRINLATKVGSMFNVPFFNDVERAFLAEVENTETWEQVVDVATRLYEYCKQEKEDKKEQKKNQPEESMMDDSDEEESLELDQEESDDDSDDADSFDSDSEDEDSEDADEEMESSMAEEDDEGSEEPMSETDKAFRKNESSLANTGQEIVNLHFPEDIAKHVVSAKDFIASMEARNQDKPSMLNMCENMYREFLGKNRGLIDVYLREFMMRKSAAAWKKARVSDTGDICASRLAQYRMTDQIFKSRTILPEGKNHGMMLLLDCSSSMVDKIILAVEQTLVLAHFCRKAAIPFRVIGYSSTYASDRLSSTRESKNGELLVGRFSFFEMLNSNLSDRLFKKACHYMLGYARHYDYRVRYYQAKYFSLDIPAQFEMGSTPLEDCLMAAVQMIPEWKQKNRLDKVNLIVLNDGDTDVTTKYMNNGQIGHISTYDPNMRYNLQIGKRTYRISPRGNRLECINRYLREELNVETYGFYMLGSARRRDIHSIYSFAIDKNGINFFDKAKEMMKEQRYFESYRDGFTRYFVVLMKEEAEVAIDVGNSKGKALVTKISKAFQKNTVNKKLNRIIATKFMEMAA